MNYDKSAAHFKDKRLHTYWLGAAFSKCKITKLRIFGKKSYRFFNKDAATFKKPTINLEKML